MRFYFLFSLFFTFTFVSVSAQTQIKGQVLDNDNKPVKRARILANSLKNSKFTFTDTDGKFQLNFEAVLQGGAQVIASSLGYDNDTLNFSFSPITTLYNANFKLKPSSKPIEEVIIVKRKPIEVKKDTVVYNTENFIDGSEKNIEDLLKKLPGINVKESGSIEFKGKTVVAVMFDGADLFNSNYATGTRSINPNIIDQVQAIENWSDNPILKDLSAERKVALNIKLKKDKLDLSSSISTETDFHSRYNFGGYAMVFNSLAKSFATTNYNNIGVNKSPIELSANILSLDGYNELKYQSSPIIRSNPIDVTLGADKANRNKQWFSSLNTVFSINDKTNLKFIGSVTSDRIAINEISERYYTIHNESIYTKDENNIVKRPRFYEGTLELRYKKSTKEYLQFTGKLNYLDENIQNQFFSNFSNDLLFLTKDLHNFFSKNELVYTLKLKGRSAAQLKTIYSYNKRPQALWMSPALPVFDNKLLKDNMQNVLSSKNSLGAEIIWYRVSENQRINASIGFLNQKYFLTSTLRIGESNFLKDFQNDFYYSTQCFFTHLDYSFDNQNWNINFNQKSQFLNQKLSENLVFRKSLFLPQSSLVVSKLLFNKTSAFLSGNIVSSPIAENYLFGNNILVSNRNIIRNQNDLDFETSQNYSFGMSYNDSFLSQFKATLSIGYDQNRNGFASQYILDSVFAYTENFRMNNPIVSKNIMLNLEKFFSPISSRFNLKTVYYTSNYYNNINDYEFVKINSNSLQINMIHQIAFRFPLKIRNDFDFLYNEMQSDINEKSNNSSFRMKNVFSYSFQRNKYSFAFANLFFVPNLQQDVMLWLMNFNFNYSPKDSRIMYFFNFNNILNEKYNYNKFLQDNYIGFHKVELLPRFFTIGLKLNI